MNKPSYLQETFWAIYLDMDSRGALTENKKSFFLNAKLKHLWGKAGKYIDEVERRFKAGNCVSDEVEIQFKSDAASFLVGCFFTPLDFYNRAGTVANPSTKTTIRTNQLKANKLIIEALTLTNKLIGVLREVEDITAYHPDEFDFLALIESMEIDGITLPIDSSPSWKISTIDALTKLTHGLANHPEMADIFKNSPGIIGQKSSWVDWLTEAENQICLLQRIYPGTLDLTESDWSNVYCALIDPKIDAKTARDNYIKPALEKIKKDKLQQVL